MVRANSARMPSPLGRSKARCSAWSCFREILLKHVVRTPEVYLIPRSDGRLLVGATVEEAGFDKRTDPDTIQACIVPRSSSSRSWRTPRFSKTGPASVPERQTTLPILGATTTPGYYVATGHFRDGILLAPITAQVMADVIEGRRPEYDLTPFSPQRF